MQKLIKIMIWIIFSSVLAAGLLLTLAWATTFHPDDIQAEEVVCPENAPVLQSGQPLKILTYNVQYMAGKNYVFFYDLPHDAGPDERPSPDDINQTLNEVARIIRNEDPDIILLQEVDDGAKRTDYQDQSARLLELLPDAYRCYASAFYWQAVFVPHPRIRGAMGHKLTTISKYRIDEATRYQLPLSPLDPLTQLFFYKRAILETRLTLDNAKDFVALNTHLEVSTQGTELKQAEIAQIDAHLTQLNQSGHLWVLGGDFNLLPPGQHHRLRADQQTTYRPNTELTPLFNKYPVVPGPADINSDNYAQWFTVFPNNPSITQPDRTIDYIFFAKEMGLVNAYVRQKDTLHISDHQPVVAEFELP
jgi:endonuclease/exonuclease/phosphatase family metal-dependent hydrolase